MRSTHIFIPQKVCKSDGIYQQVNIIKRMYAQKIKQNILHSIKKLAACGMIIYFIKKGKNIQNFKLKKRYFNLNLIKIKIFLINLIFHCSLF